jgi:hypothetical protein
MHPRSICQFVLIGAVIFASWASQAEPEVILPGKGLTLQEGVFAEYRSLVARNGQTNEVLRTRFLVLERSDAESSLWPVVAVSFARGNMINRKLVYYDTSRGANTEGRLESRESETVRVGPRELSCLREKRVSDNGIALTWSCTEVPISGIVRNVVSSGDKKLISELVLFGPDGLSDLDIKTFLDSLNPLKQPVVPPPISSSDQAK